MSQILLVRHGQASWGAADYDVLSELGERQSFVLGEALAVRGVRPDLLVRGSMRRHRQTTEQALAGAGWPHGDAVVDEVLDAAVITEDDYQGPPVVGDSVSYLPNIAPLQPGNRTHNVRIDILAQEIEIAPGVRYQAWTVGGTVPGPDCVPSGRWAGRCRMRCSRRITLERRDS